MGLGQQRETGTCQQQAPGSGAGSASDGQAQTAPSDQGAQHLGPEAPSTSWAKAPGWLSLRVGGERRKRPEPSF